MLAKEMFKVYQSMSPPIFSKLFRRRDIYYNLRGNSNFSVLNVKSVFHGSKILSHLGPKTWDIVPLELRVLIDKKMYLSKILETFGSMLTGFNPF